MANRYPAFKSFTAGEISPRMYARSDLPMYHHAVAKAENFNITPQGSAILRRGWRYLGDAGNDEYVRLLTFSRALGEDIVIVLSEDSIQAFNSSGEVIVDIGDIAGPPITIENEMVTDGSFGNGFAQWDEEYYVNTANPTMGPPTVIAGWATFKRRDNVSLDITEDSWATQVISKPAGDPLDNLLTVTFQIKFDQAAFPTPPQSSIIGTLSWKAILFEDDGVTVIEEIQGNTTGTKAFAAVDMTSRTSVVIRLGCYGQPSNQVLTHYSGAQYSAVSAIFKTQEDSSAPGEFPWAKEELPFVQTEMLTGQDTMMLVSRRVLPYTLEYDPVANRLQLRLAVFAGSPPWVDGDSVGVIEIFQGRLWLMSTVTDPSGIWGSKSGELLDFTVGANANDALYLPLATKGVIQWAVGQNETISIGTDLGEYVLSANGPVLTPSDAAATQVSAYGSTFIQAQMVGDQVMFITPDARKLLVTNYDDNIKNWTATELSWIAQHLTANHIIRFLDMRNPDYQIVCSTRDGYWIQCLYDRTLGLVGWQRNTQVGQINSMCVTKSIDGDVLWAAIKYAGKISMVRIESTLSPRIHLDYWSRRFLKEDEDGWYVDDLAYLAESKVSAIVDGALVPDLQVTAEGTLRLPYGGSEAFIGLPYTGTLVTLPEEPTDNVESLSGGKKRNANITVRLVDSAMPKINGKRPADRSPTTPMDTREPNVTTDINVRSLGWDGQGLITIEQDKPFRTEVVGIFTKLGANKT